MKIKVMLALSTLTSASVLANPDPSPYHGYISTPASRAVLCQRHENTNCGAIQYEPQSVEGPKGFPGAGPRDGEIASGGRRFQELDEYGKDRWKKVPVKSGPQTIVWNLTAPHRTTDWEFYITKQNWDPSKPLTRDALDLTPFCSQTDAGDMPKTTVKIDCDVPKRTGYQLILGVWNIYDTGNAFYQVIDADFSSK